MRPLLRSINTIARPVFGSCLTAASQQRTSTHLRRLSRLQKASACWQCQSQPRQPWILPQSRLFSSKSDGEDKPGDSTKSVVPELKNLPSQRESRRSDASKRFSHAMDDLQTALFSAGQKLNDLTGYSDIETLKKSIEQQEQHVKSSRLEVAAAKEAYQAAISRRSASQREVNELLQRKHAWSASDLERFTSLYRSDHANEQEESAAAERLAQAERTADEAQAQLARSILARYHEEQIWSDKIRRASTWGTWGLMGFNVLLFIVVQLGLEPWKRRRLVGGFEEKVREVIQEENLRNTLMHMHPEQPEVVDEAVERVVITPMTKAVSPTDPQSASVGSEVDLAATGEMPVESKQDSTIADVEVDGEAPVTRIAPVETERMIQAIARHPAAIMSQVKETTRQLFSHRKIVISQRDLTLAVMQAVTVGAFLSAVIIRVLSGTR